MSRTEQTWYRDPKGSTHQYGRARRSSSRLPRLSRDPVKYEVVVCAVGLILGVTGQLLHSSATLYVGATFAAIGFGMLWVRAMKPDRH